MNTYDIDTLEGLRRAVTYLRYTNDHSEEAEKLALKCIQKAQFFKDVDLEFTARYAFVQNAFFINNHNVALSMYPWLLKKCDEDRERFDYHSTLWAYKWIIGNAKDFAKIPLDKINALFADMERRFKDYGAGEKVIHYFKLRFFDSIGEQEKAAREYKLYQQASTTSILDDCKACQPNNILDHLIAHERNEEALELSGPLTAGSLTCVIVPETTFPKLIFPALMLGRIDEAHNFAVLAAKRLKANQSRLPEAAELIKYYALKGDIVKGRNLIQKQLPFALKGTPEVARFYFYLSINIFLFMLKAHRHELKIVVPKELSVCNETGTYTVDELANFFEKELDQVITDLNMRNGNTYYSELKERTIKKTSEIELQENE